MSMNEADTRFHRMDPVLREKGYVRRERIALETILTPAPVESTGPKGRHRKKAGRTDYLLCVQVGDMPEPLPVVVLEAKKESEDPLKGMQQQVGILTLDSQGIAIRDFLVRHLVLPGG